MNEPVHTLPPLPPAEAGGTPGWLNGLAVLVLGLGDSGLAMARWCANAGAQLQVWDSREAPPQAQALAEQLPQVQRLTGPLDPALASAVQLVLKSPGLAPHEAAIAPLLAAARERGLAVMGELDLFVRALAELKAGQGYAPKLLAVTGTNGKTTTTAMAALLVERAGRRVATAGNIGPSLLDTLARAVAAPREAWPEVWVLELSSFQLEGGGTGVAGFEPDAAVVLNLSQDHLDWHGSMAAYAAAKARIYGAQAVMVVNRDDALVEAMVPPPVIPKGRKTPTEAPRKVLRFGLAAPNVPGEFGLVVENGMAWLVRALPEEEGARRKKDEPAEIHLQRLMPADALRVRGRHNAANALAALALATAIDCPLAPMLHGLREYRGERHRTEPVGAVGGVSAVDDSKGTNVGATVAAIEGLGADLAPHKLLLILGGDGKGQDFSPLVAPLMRFARAVALIGRDAGPIDAALAELALARETHADLPAAVAWCFDQAEPGDTVLLSPACASLDMFRNYGHRAEVFIQAVQALAAERGELAS